MKIKELIFEEKEIPNNTIKEVSCLNQVGIESLEKEAACLQELGVESYEIDYIITLRFKKEENKI